MTRYIIWWTDALCDVINHFPDEMCGTFMGPGNMTALSQATKMCLSLCC